MKTILNQLFAPFLSEIGLYPSEDASKRSGLCYRPDPCLGSGFIWIYPVDNLYAISVYDVVFKADISFQYQHPAFLTIGSYEPPIARLMYSGANSKADSLLGYIGQEAAFRQEVQKNVPLRSVGISLTPEFCENLTDRFSQDFQRLPDIVARLVGEATIPEAAVALRQLRASDPSGGAAKAYYEGKLLETLSIVMQWGQNQMWFSGADRIRDWEFNSLHEISSYLKQNYAGPVSLSMLARLACMSRNKLTYGFKHVFGMTITEYIQTLRMERAKELLLDSDWDIGAIANAVGYKLHRSFSEAFKEATAFTPSEFRKQMLQAGSSGKK